MKKSNLESKRVFLVVAASPERIQTLSGRIQEHISGATIFHAEDGVAALFKMGNVTPHVVLVDSHIAKMNSLELAQRILNDKKSKDASIILISPLPDTEHFVDAVVTSQVQFLTDSEDQSMFGRCINRALDRLTIEERSSYRLRFLANGEILFNEGDGADSVFFVKKGSLEARKEAGAKLLGPVAAGEFVGEMAHFNTAPRSATVAATSDCELIEIPFSALEMVLFSKPAWSKALISTLTTRLKKINERV